MSKNKASKPLNPGDVGNSSLLCPAPMAAGRAYWIYLNELAPDAPFERKYYEGMAKYLTVDSKAGKILSVSAEGSKLFEEAEARTVDKLKDGAFNLMRGSRELYARYFRALLLEIAANSMAALQAHGMAGWFNYGQPVVEVGHKLAASLMTTSIGSTTLTNFRAPWRSFIMRFPPNLLYASSPHSGENVSLDHALMINLLDATGVDGWGFIAPTKKLFCLWGLYPNPEEFVSCTNHKDVGVFDFDFNKVDDRSSLLLRRLLINVSLLMTDRSSYKESGSASHRLFSQSRRRWEKEPVNRNFKLTTKVSCDFRETVTNYVLGRGKRINVQSLVCGHWKNQAHGPQLSLRKKIFVEPYWRGPEDAPIAMRSHHLKQRGAADG